MESFPKNENKTPLTTAQRLVRLAVGRGLGDYENKKKLEFSEELLLAIEQGYKESLDLSLEFELINKDKKFIGEDGSEYTFPSIEEVKNRIQNEKELFELKFTQYENPKMSVVPLIAINKYLDTYGNELDIYDNNDLLYSINKDGQKYKITSKGKNPTLDKKELLWKWEGGGKGYDGLPNSLVYDPESFDDNHNGKNKNAILKKFNGFVVVMSESGELIRKGDGKVINNRKQIKSGESPNKYLEKLKTNEQYKGEVGLYPEESWFGMLQTLKEGNGLIKNDWQGKGCLEGSLGAYFSASGCVPYLYFSRDGRQARASGWYPSRSDDDSAVSFAVRV